MQNRKAKQVLSGKWVPMGVGRIEGKDVEVNRGRRDKGE
jgi:hypothetical protein